MSTSNGGNTIQDEEQDQQPKPRQASKLPTIIVIVVFYIVLFGICGTGLLIAFIAYNRV